MCLVIEGRRNKIDEKDALMRTMLYHLWGFKGDLYCCLLFNFILDYSILTPHYLAGLTSSI